MEKKSALKIVFKERKVKDGLFNFRVLVLKFYYLMYLNSILNYLDIFFILVVIRVYFLLD